MLLKKKEIESEVLLMKGLEMENNHYVQRVLENSENSFTVLIERDVSLKEAISIFFNRRIKEIVFVDVKECIQSNLVKQ